MKKRVLSIFLSLLLVLTTFVSVLPVQTQAFPDQTIRQAGKAIILKGISTIPGGSTVAPLLGPVLGKILGIKSDSAEILEQLDLVNEKLDEIIKALEEIDEKLDAEVDRQQQPEPPEVEAPRPVERDQQKGHEIVDDGLRHVAEAAGGAGVSV